MTPLVGDQTPDGWARRRIARTPPRYLAGRAVVTGAVALTIGLLVRRVTRERGRGRRSAPPATLFTTAVPMQPGKVLHHVALFTVHERYDDQDERHRIADELQRRLQALEDLPELAALWVHLSELEDNADVLLSAEYREAIHLDRIRDQPRHQAMLDWYNEHFDETQRKEINYWSPAMKEIVLPIDDVGPSDGG